MRSMHNIWNILLHLQILAMSSPCKVEAQGTVHMEQAQGSHPTVQVEEIHETSQALGSSDNDSYYVHQEASDDDMEIPEVRKAHHELARDPDLQSKSRCGKLQIHDFINKLAMTTWFHFISNLHMIDNVYKQEGLSQIQELLKQ